MNAPNLSLHSYVKGASPCTRALWQNKMTSPCSQNSTQVCDRVLCFCSFIPLTYALWVITRQPGSNQTVIFCTAALQSERLVSLVPVDSPSFSSKLPEANCRQYSDTYRILTRRQFKHGIGTLHSGYTVVSRGTLRKFK